MLKSDGEINNLEVGSGASKWAQVLSGGTGLSLIKKRNVQETGHLAR